MATKTISLSNSNIDHRTKELFDKANKHGQNILTIDLFSNLIDDLLTIPKVTYKQLNNLLQDTKFDNNPNHHLSQIIKKPFKFLNEHKQLLSFEQVIHVLEAWDLTYTKNEIMIAWIYHFFYKKESQFYVPKYKLVKELEKVNWTKFNVQLSDFIPLLVEIENTYYTTQQFIDLEKSTGDNMIDHFYIDPDELSNDEEIPLSNNISYTSQQSEAINSAIKYPLSVISGFPGTGKSTIINEIVRYYDNKDTYCWLMAPTGKAIKDLKHKCGKNADPLAGTIHRFIYVTYPQVKSSSCDDKAIQQFKAKYKNPFEVFIIDEASMIAFDLFIKLINIIITHNAKLVLVGDKYQLPPIQVGRPFESIINSNIFPTIFLEEIKRTDKPILTSNIKKFIKDGLSQNNFDDSEMIFHQTTDFSDKNLKQMFQSIYDSFGDFKVITPQHKFDGGVEQCNKILQKLFNTKQPKVCDHFNTTFYVNDVIIQKENDYSRDPPRMNGDVATIISVDKTFHANNSKNANFNCSIKYHDNEEKRVISTLELKDEFNLFYCATVHKFQGSQETTCVIILSNQHTMWSSENNRKLFYTAISRAKERCIIIGDLKVFFKLKYNRSDMFYTKFMKEFNDYDL